MKNELVAVKKSEVEVSVSMVDIAMDFACIVRDLGRIAYEVGKRVEPDVKDALFVALNNLFLAFDWLLCLIIDFIPVVTTTVKVGFNALARTVIGRNVSLFFREVSKAASEVKETTKGSIDRFVASVPFKVNSIKDYATERISLIVFITSKIAREFKMELIYLWQFRKEIIEEDKYEG